jgi:hypothetical protein
VEHHRRVDAFEDPRVEEQHLAAAALFGGGSDEVDGGARASSA